MAPKQESKLDPLCGKAAAEVVAPLAPPVRSLPTPERVADKRGLISIPSSLFLFDFFLAAAVAAADVGDTGLEGRFCGGLVVDVVCRELAPLTGAPLRDTA